MVNEYMAGTETAGPSRSMLWLARFKSDKNTEKTKMMMATAYKPVGRCSAVQTMLESMASENNDRQHVAAE